MRRRPLLFTPLLGMLPPAHAQRTYELTPWPKGLPVPPLQAQDLRGQRWNLKNLRGSALVLNFWAVHEEYLFKRFLTPEMFTRLSPRLFNLHPVAKRYMNRLRKFGSGGSANKKSLEECFAVIYSKRHPYPPFPMGAAEACRRIDTAWAIFLYIE